MIPNYKIVLVFSNVDIELYRKHYSDENTQYIFLGEKFYPAKNTLASNIIKVDADVKDSRKKKESIELIIKKLDRYTNDLTDILNKVHKLNYPSSYWRKLLGSFWIHFLSVVDDRFYRVKKLNEKVDKISAPRTIPYVRAPRDSWEFTSQVKEVVSEYQIIDLLTQHSLIKLKSNFEFEESNISKDSGTSINFPRKILNFILFWKKPILIVDGYFDHFESLKIMLYSKFKIIFIPSKFFTRGCCENTSNFYPNRKYLRVKVEDEFDEAVNCLLSSFFPKSFFEDFKPRRDYSCFYRDKLSGLGTAVCVQTDDTYKIMLAEMYMHGKKSIGFQHGGNYGLLKLKLAEYIEKETNFLFVGWSDAGGLNKLKKLDRYKKLRKSSNKNKFLWVSTSTSKHTYRHNIADSSDEILEMYDQQRDFYSYLAHTIRDQVVLRPYPKDFGWSYKELWLKRFQSQIKFSKNINFYEDLISTKLYFSDHISTTWIEALYMDIPILLVFPIDKYDFKDDFIKVLRMLEEQNVYHQNYQSAASFLNAQFHNVEGWWSSKKCSIAVSELKLYLYSNKELKINDKVKFILDITK